MVKGAEETLLDERDVGRVETVLSDGVGGSLVEEVQGGQTVLGGVESGRSDGESTGSGKVKSGGNPGSSLSRLAIVMRTRSDARERRGCRKENGNERGWEISRLLARPLIDIDRAKD